MKSVRWIWGGLGVVAGGYVMFMQWLRGPITDHSGQYLLIGGSLLCLGLAILLYRATEAALDLLTLSLMLAAGSFALTAVLAADGSGVGHVLKALAAGSFALAFVVTAIVVTVQRAVGPRLAGLILAIAFWCVELGLVLVLVRDLVAADYPGAVQILGAVLALPLILRSFVQPGRKAALGFLILGMSQALTLGWEIHDRSALDLGWGAVNSVLCLLVAFGLHRPQPPGLVTLMSLLDKEVSTPR